MKLKNLFYLISFVLLAGLASCDRYEPVTIFQEDDFYRFETFESTVAENATEPISIPVVFTSKDGADANGSVSFAVSGATEGVDYTVAGAQTLSFNSGNDFTDNIMILPVDNGVTATENLVLEITLVNPSQGIVGFPGPSNGVDPYVHKLTIADDDCPAVAIGGSYDALTTAGASTDGCCPDPADGFAAVVTIQAVSGDQYFMNDFSAGLYLEWYDVYGISSQNQTPATFTVDANGNMTFDPGQGDPFGGSLSGGGTYDKCTGTITYRWDNTFGDFGEVTLTVQ